MSPRSFLLSFCALSLITLLAYALSFGSILGAPLAAEYWLRGTSLVKLKLARDVESPKVLFVGGSSTLFSIDTAQLSMATGKSVINMGLHAGLPLKYHFDFAKKALRHGDTVVVVPEYGYYRRSAANTEWFINQVLAWDGEYYRNSSVKEKAKLVIDTPGMEIVNAVLSDIFSKRIREKFPYRYPVTEEEALKVFRAGWNNVRAKNSPERRVFQYYFNNINDHGDINNTVGSDFPKTSGYGLITGVAFNGDALSEIANFKEYCDSIGVKMVMGFAPIMNDGIVKQNITAITRSMDAIKSKMTRMGIMFIDSPGDVFFDQKYFFDTDSHLNIDGRKLRSQGLEAKI